MRRIAFPHQALCVLTALVFLLTGRALASDSYTLKPLFRLQSGTGIDRFRVAFAPAPFAPYPGLKVPVGVTGVQVLVNNIGSFYLLTESERITKFDADGNVLAEINGVPPFTVPRRMYLDGEDNLHVVFRNDTNVGSRFRYVVAKFDRDGRLLHWIKGEEDGFRCIFADVAINGTVFLTSCADTDNPDQMMMYDREGGFLGLFEHRKTSHRRAPEGEGGGFTVIRHDITEGADGNIYVVSSDDLTVKKYLDQSDELRSTEGVSPSVIRTMFPWMDAGKPAFRGFDINNKMFFYDFSDRRVIKQAELAEHVISVLDFSKPLRLEAFMYDFDRDSYKTLECSYNLEEESKFALRWPLRNYAGELYEMIIYLNDPPNPSPQDHVRFFKWVEVK